MTNLITETYTETDLDDETVLRVRKIYIPEGWSGQRHLSFVIIFDGPIGTMLEWYDLMINAFPIANRGKWGL